MRRAYIALLVTMVTFIGSAKASAEPFEFWSVLTNAQENPPTVPTTSTGAPRPASSGTAFLVLNEAMTALSLTATVFNIDFTGSQTADPFDDLVAAHIHASPTVTPATNAGVVWGFFGTPFNDNNPNDVVVAPFATGVGGVISGKWDAPEGNMTTLAAQLPNILTERSYLNFHTRQFGGGEIRGTISPVPEPSTMILAGLGTAALFRLRRRLRRRDTDL